MNQQPYAVPPQWWAPKLHPFWVRMLRRHRLWLLKRKQRITQIEVSGIESVQAALASGAGLLITPNHSFHFDAYVLFEAAARVQRPFYFLASWQLFAMSGPWERWMLQMHGIFSIDRETSDLRAIKKAVDIIKTSPYPLVVFPEGEIYHTNDRLTPFRDGAAAMAISAAKRADRPIMIVPTALKAWYQHNPEPRLLEIIQGIERRFNWRSRPKLAIQDRIYRIATAILSLKEVEYLGAAQTGPLATRLQDLAETLLARIEAQSAIAAAGGIIPERVKNVRRHHIRLLQKSDLAPEERTRLLSEMEDLFFVVQLFSYPADYAVAEPSCERLAEIIDKFEEDLLGLTYPTIKGDRRVALKFGEPIAVEPYIALPDGAQQLTRELENRVQGLLNELNQNGHEGQTTHLRSFRSQ